MAAGVSEVMASDRRCARAETIGGSAHGYAFADIVFTMALTAVLAAMAVPRIPQFFSQFQLSNAAGQLATDLVRVRTKAIGEGNQYRFLFDSNGYRVLVNNGVTFVADGSPPIMLPAGTSFQSMPSTLTFSAIGMLANGESFALGNGTDSKTVQINELGRVSVRAGS